MKKHTLAAAFALVLAAILPAWAAPYVGWIPIQYATAGKPLTLDMRRFYEPAPGFRLDFPAKGDHFTASLDPQSLVLTVTTEKSAGGLIDIPLRIASETNNSTSGEAILSLAMQPDRSVPFRFERKEKKPTSVFVAGSFNAWSTSANPLTETSPGVFEARIELPPGPNEYKFFVDGEWTPDPSNPRQSADGQNALIDGAPAPAGNPPTLFVESSSADSLAFRIIPGSDPVTKISAIAQNPDGSSATVPFVREGDTIKIDVSGFPANSWIRLAAADSAGRITNTARGQVKPDGGFQWQDGILYYAFTDRFVDGDKSNTRPVDDGRVLPQANYYGGDFAGIQQRIEEGYFRDLGVNILWLAPLNRNPEGAWQEYLPPYRFYTGYHGYWPVSDTEVEPRFGGEQGLKNLVESAHKNGTKIIADLVLKHVHLENPLWKEKREWFGTVDLPDGTKNLRRWNDHQFTTWFEEWLPGFDFSNPAAVSYLLSNAEDWVTRFDLDGYRLDAVKHIEFSFWPKFRTAMRNLEARESKPPGAMYFVGETFMDRQGIMSFVGPNMLDGQFDFPLYDTIMDVLGRRSHGFQDLEKSLLASETAYGKETLMSPLVGNHDKSRFMAYADGDLPDAAIPDEEELGWAKPPQVDNAESYEYLKLATAFILAIDGVPMIYYGDEVGLTGAGDPDNRRMMPLENELNAAQKSVRTQFSKAALARQAHPALRYGSRRALVAEGDRYAFVRRHLGDAVLCVWNRGENPAEFEIDVAPELPDGNYIDALGGMEIEVEDGEAEFDLPPLSCAFFVKK